MELKEIQEKINNFYIRIDAINSTPTLYNQIDSNNMGLKQKLFMLYLAHEKITLCEAEEILSEFK